MDIRNAIKKIFGGKDQTYSATKWKEIGAVQSNFAPFSGDAYSNDLYRACVRVLADHTSKANARVLRRNENGIEISDKQLQRLIQQQPNYYMNGQAFLAKARTYYEIDGTVFILIERDDFGKCKGLYPVPSASWEAWEYNGELYINFKFKNGQTRTLAWDDLAVLRKDYNQSDIWGDSNKPILKTLELLDVSNQGIANAIRSTANLRGVLKSKQTMLKDGDAKKLAEDFVKDYLNLENSSGIASLDSTMDFQPISLDPKMAQYEYVKELNNNVFRYTGVNENILLSKYNSVEWQAFYEGKIETFLVGLSLELTNKIFTQRERGFGNEIMFESNRMAYLSIQEKQNLVSMVDRGAMTPNEWRQTMNLAPLEGGDKPIRRLDTEVVKEPNLEQEVQDANNTE